MHPSNTYKNLEEMEKEAKELDVELEKMVLKGAKHRVNLCLIEVKSGERRRLREAIQLFIQEMYVRERKIDTEEVRNATGNRL